MKRSFLSLFLALPVLCFAQANYLKGYVVTHTKDTLRGFIDYKEEFGSPSSFTFKKEINDASTTYGAGSVSAFAVDGSDLYERYVVNLSMGQTEVAALSVGIDTSSIKKEVFLKVLQVGKNVKLLSYTDDLKSRFYVLDGSDVEPVELVRRLYYSVENVREIISQNKYVNQLLLLMRKYGLPAQNEQKLVDLKYDENSLKEVVAMINGDKVTRSKSALFLFAGSGLNFTRISYNGSSDFNTGTETNKGSLFPFLNAGVDVFINPAIGKTIFRVELALSYSKNLTSNINPLVYKSLTSHSFSQFNIALSPQFKYNFYNTAKIKVFGQAGFAINYAIYSDNKVTWYDSLLQTTSEFRDAIKLEKIYYAFPLTTGVVVNKKLEISLGYIFPSEISDYSESNVRTSSFRVGVAYLFGKH